MVSLLPFQGFHYNAEKVKDFGLVIAPPYDQISEDMQNHLYEQSPYNFIRLIFGKVFPEDNEAENRYTRAEKSLTQWRQDGVLVQDKEPAFYLYEQKFQLYDQWLTRTGLVGLMRLEPLGKGVFPHEKTFPKPKEDRLKLMKTCKSNFEHVFFLYDDPDRSFDKILNPSRAVLLFSCKDAAGTTHTISKILEPEVLRSISSFFKDKNLLIADGHHRYETSLAYQQELRSIFCSSTVDEAPFNFRLGTFVSLQNKGLKILPTHRVLKNLSESQIQLLEQGLNHYFDLNTAPDLSSMLERMGRKNHSFGVTLGGKFLAAVLKPSVDIEKEFPEVPAVLRELDVFLLHHLIFQRLLQIPAEKSDEWIEYIRWPEEVLQRVKNNSHRAAFFLNPVKPEQVRKVAESGEKMPHKSTDFYPKLWSGLVFYKMDF